MFTYSQQQLYCMVTFSYIANITSICQFRVVCHIICILLLYCVASGRLLVHLDAVIAVISD